MKKFSEIQDLFKEMKKFKSPEEIAKKHKVPLNKIIAQLNIGIPIEHEHTKDEKMASIIALQHLDEVPDYYTKLKKVESNKKEKLEEKYTRIQKTGNTYTIFLSWRAIPKKIQMFFPNMKMPTKEEVQFEINKIYPGAIILSYKPSELDPTKPYLISGEAK